MNILVIGSGGREHALVYGLKKSSKVGEIYISPGNAGINKIANPILLTIDQSKEVIKFCKDKNISLVVIGPEAPLVDGLSDDLENAGILTFGVSKKAAQLEGSKEFTKIICDKYNIPTAQYESFTNADDAKKYIADKKLPLVIKADGLAAGKGVVIANDLNEANKAIDELMVNKIFGNAGSLVVIEEFLEGEELSFFAVVDGKKAVAFGSAQDHKAVGEGDVGANTGGMGTYSPAPIIDDSLHKEIMDKIIDPLVDGMNKEGMPYKGILFAGLMITKQGAKLLEVNVRFGDPETQVLMARLDSDLLDIMTATASGDLDGIDIKMKPKAALCVVMASNGYPSSYSKGKEIKGLDKLSNQDDLIIYHAGTKLGKNGEILSNGGRVLGVTAIDDSVELAQNKAYAAVDQIDWEDGFCRRDIGWRAIK